MEVIFALLVGALYAAGFYLLLRRSPVRLIVGLAFLSHAAHLLIFASAGLERGGAPLVAEGAAALTPPHADPLPQALVLTAIVISFAILAFALVLFGRTVDALGSEADASDDMDQLTASAQGEEE